MTRNSTRLLLLVGAALFFSSAFPNPAPAQTVSFIARKDFASGTSPRSVAVGDFNGDGVQDLAVADAGSWGTGKSDGDPGSVSVLLGIGDGTFQAPLTFAAGRYPWSVTVGDFNGDGRLDLAVANYGSNDVSVLLGTGDGTFQAALTFAAGTNPQSVAVADFNGDGRLDLAVANLGSGSSSNVDNGNVSVLLGNGDGTFQAALIFEAGTNPKSVAVGDFNGDGAQDLAVAKYDGVSVLLGNGDGTFQAPLSFGAGTYPLSIAVGDFNGDGKLDLTTNTTSSNAISVLLGNGDGTFQAPLIVTTGTYVDSVAVADFNGDRKLDLLGADGSGNVLVLLGNGDGTFQAPLPFAAGRYPRSVAVGDFNGDGKLDSVTANSIGSVSVLLGNGDGTFLEAPRFPSETRPSFVRVDNFNGDGKQDLLIANLGYLGSNTVSVLLGNGDGTFQSPLTSPVGDRPVSIAVGDFNSDGVQDLAVANYGSSNVSVLLGNGDGTFQAALTFAAGTSPSVVGDFNGDGKLDLVGADGGGNVLVLLGNGDGTFQTALTSAAGTSPSVVGDFNGDGKLDLVGVKFFCCPQQVTVSVLLGNGDGTFQAPLKVTAGSHIKSVAVGDFNGDSVQDLAVASDVMEPNTGGVSVLLGNGDGTFQAALTFAIGNFPRSVALGDFNGDGKLDLAADLPATNEGSNSISVLLGNGDGTSRPAQTFGVGSGPVSVAVGYFNGNGKLDLVVGDGAVANGDGVSVLINNTPPARNSLTVSKAGTGSGTVTSSESPPKIDCGATCSASYESGTVVTLTATPVFGSIFTGWSGCDTVSGTTCTVTMSTARSVTASFLGIPPLLPPLF